MSTTPTLPPELWQLVFKSLGCNDLESYNSLASTSKLLYEIAWLPSTIEHFIGPPPPLFYEFKWVAFTRRQLDQILPLDAQMTNVAIQIDKKKDLVTRLERCMVSSLHWLDMYDKQILAWLQKNNCREYTYKDESGDLLYVSSQETIERPEMGGLVRHLGCGILPNTNYYAYNLCVMARYVYIRGAIVYRFVYTDESAGVEPEDHRWEPWQVNNKYLYEPIHEGDLRNTIRYRVKLCRDMQDNRLQLTALYEELKTMNLIVMPHLLTLPHTAAKYWNEFGEKKIIAADSVSLYQGVHEECGLLKQKGFNEQQIQMWRDRRIRCKQTTRVVGGRGSEQL